MPDLASPIVYVLLFVALFSEVFLLLSFLEHYFKPKKAVTGTSKTPSVTIIVPCHNEELTVDKTVHSLLSLDYPKDKLSIFIIDDGSTDNTWEVMQQFKGHEQIRLFQKENGGKHTALNLGIENTHSDLVGCLDADSFVEQNALKEIVRYFDNPATMAVTPAIKLFEPKTLIQLMQKAEYLASIFLRKTFSFIDALFVTPGPFSIFRREVFDKIGGYKKAHNTEDLEMALRMQYHHMKIENAHTAAVYTVGPKTFRELYHQRIRWTYGFLKNCLDYRFMFFKPKYGNLGVFSLVVGVTSIFSAIFFLILFIVQGTVEVMEKVERFQTVGWWYQLRMPEFDLFFVNTHSILLITVVLVSFVLLIVLIGKWISSERKVWTADIPIYLVIYGFLAPLWLVGAVYNVIASRTNTWR
jgi:cellulose synthase/poly-beta-1,6-N-acetylglucosamine synthase-like glycosyltransferase